MSESAIPTGWLAIAVAFASLTILLLACCAPGPRHPRPRRLEQETDRMRGLANAAVEGLLVCDGERIVTANRSFANLIGIAEERVEGCSAFVLHSRRSGACEAAGHPASSSKPACATRSGAMIRVELIARPVIFANQPRHAVAVRDLRAREEGRGRPAPPRPSRFADWPAQPRSFNNKLDREIATAAADGGCLALLCLDLDRFKEVNDLFGHAAGDTLLQSVARCTAAVLKPGQMLARLGGDEFAIIAPGLPDAAAAGHIAESIIDAFRAENEDAPNGGLVSCSIGIAIYPNDAIDRQSLMSHADTALYRAKVEGRGTYRFFEAAMGAEVRERRHIEHDLLHAVSRGELRLAYQPQKHLTTGEILGFEALLRWQHAERGAISPEHLHPDRRRERTDPADRRMGPAHRLPRGGDVAAPAHRGRQRLGGAASRRAILASGA